MSVYGTDHLYVISDASGAFKVGRSLDPERRLADFQVGCPTELTLSRVKKHAGFLEPVFHHLFGHERIRGEWYPAKSFAADVISVWHADPGVDAGTHLIAFGHAVYGQAIQQKLIDDHWIDLDPARVEKASVDGLRYGMAVQAQYRDEYHRRAQFYADICKIGKGADIVVPALPRPAFDVAMEMFHTIVGTAVDGEEAEANG